MSRKLQYFDVNGYAEAVRYMLHYGKLEFEDIRYKRDDWPIKSVKDALPYGQLPIYEEDGRVLSQSLAIARYVAHEVGLLPSDPWEQAVVEAAALNCYDFVKKIVTLMLDPSKIEENKKNIDEAVEFYLSRFEKELKTGNGYFGGKLSWADFILVGMIETTNLYLKGSIEKNYPTVTALISKIYSLPGIKEYVAKRGPYVLNL
uniref:glutathione transferase n=1 Tax=Glyphodes pyloalis TaxID=1242752 RepID=A0A7L4XWP6_GLYPY|nr:glutathione S-transferase sigma3 [Glyphodes pyloalis]